MSDDKRAVLLLIEANREKYLRDCAKTLLEIWQRSEDAPGAIHEVFRVDVDEGDFIHGYARALQEQVDA